MEGVRWAELELIDGWRLQVWKGEGYPYVGGLSICYEYSPFSTPDSLLGISTNCF